MLDAGVPRAIVRAVSMVACVAVTLVGFHTVAARALVWLGSDEQTVRFLETKFGVQAIQQLTMTHLVFIAVGVTVIQLGATIEHFVTSFNERVARELVGVDMSTIHHMHQRQLYDQAIDKLGEHTYAPPKRSGNGVGVPPTAAPTGTAAGAPTAVGGRAAAPRRR